MVFDILGDLQHEDGKTIVMVEQNAKKGLEFADLGYVLVSGKRRSPARRGAARQSRRGAFVPRGIITLSLQPRVAWRYALLSGQFGTNPAATGFPGRITNMLYRAGFATAVAAMAFAFAPVTAQAQGCGTIELGAAVSATGIYAANGQNTKNGYEFAVKKINDAGGVTIGGKCYHFQIKYYDDKSTPARASQLVERLIDQDKIQYVLGPYGSPLTKAILPVIEKYKTPLVQGEAASRSLFTQGYKYQFGIVATSEKL